MLRSVIRLQLGSSRGLAQRARNPLKSSPGAPRKTLREYLHLTNHCPSEYSLLGIIILILSWWVVGFVSCYFYLCGFDPLVWEKLVVFGGPAADGGMFQVLVCLQHRAAKLQLEIPVALYKNKRIVCATEQQQIQTWKEEILLSNKV